MRKQFIRMILFCTVLLYGNKAVFSQALPASTSADIYLSIQKLKVLGSVLYVAAHPDDENTRLLAYLSKDRLYRTGYLSVTRGDGGQNLIGDEQGIELGMIRTQELLSARRIDGGEQFFTRAFDFGYSKSPEETFTKWDKEKILSDVVWVIRRFQPDIIVTRFPTTGEGGHGHHTASAILANEAFAAAADPRRFPEQLKFVSTWQVKRVLWNTFNFGGTNTTRDDQLKIDVGGYNPLLGKSYGEIASESRSQHKSQGFGVASSRGEQLEYFTTTKGDQPTGDLMSGVDVSWKKISGGDMIIKMIDSLSSTFDFMRPDRSVERLVRLYKAMEKMPDGSWKKQKQKEVYELIAQCSGLFLEATTTTQFAVQTDSLKINFSLNNRLGADAVLQRITVDRFDTSFSRTLEKNRNFNFSKTLRIPVEKPITQPYWLVHKMEEGYFNVKDQQLIGQPDVEPSFRAMMHVRIHGEPFVFERPVKYKFTDPVKGELYQPLVLLPPVEFDFVNDNNFAINDSAAHVQVHFKSNLKDSAQYAFSLNHSDSWTVDKSNFVYGTFGNHSNYVSAVFRPKKVNGDLSETISIDVRKNGTKLYAGYRKSIQYDHIPYINYFKDASSLLVQMNVKTEGKHIGYITGAGDKVPEALEQMGYQVTLLGDKELSRNHLGQFDAIITGVRAYNTNDWMNKYYDKLMNYIKEGGNLIVQYNTSNFISSIHSRIGPYNFTINRNRITDENAEVKFVNPEHRVLHYPNTITQNDFKGWVQERSIYHAGQLDKNFETILSMKDPGESADEGSLIVAHYGKGTFVYTGLVFFRELPAGVPGAYRLLANLIALNKKKGF